MPIRILLPICIRHLIFVVELWSRKNYGQQIIYEHQVIYFTKQELNIFELTLTKGGNKSFLVGSRQQYNHRSILIHQTYRCLWTQHSHYDQYVYVLSFFQGWNFYNCYLHIAYTHKDCLCHTVQVMITALRCEQLRIVFDF